MDAVTVVMIVILGLIVIAAATVIYRRAASDRRIRALQVNEGGFSTHVQPQHVDHEAEAAAYAAQNNGRGNPGTMW